MKFLGPSLPRSLEIECSKSVDWSEANQLSCQKQQLPSDTIKGNIKQSLEIRPGDKVTIKNAPQESTANKGVQKKRVKDTGQNNLQSSNWEENSIQFVGSNMPGPDHYEKSDLWTYKKTPNCTFGKSQRFERVRPATAQLSYNQVEQVPKKDQINSQISFLTSKSKPRSCIKKVEYCDWIRPHFYQPIYYANYKPKQSACFSSVLQRFKQAQYTGPDFYVQQGKSNLKTTLPSHYFLSRVRRGADISASNAEQQDAEVKVGVRARWEKRKTKEAKPKKCVKDRVEKENNEAKQLEISVGGKGEREGRKNNLGQKRRAPWKSRVDDVKPRDSGNRWQGKIG